MTHPPNSSRRPKVRIIRGRRREGGAVLVEFALVLIPLLSIVFGMIEFGFMFKDSLSISSASRAGARTASAEPRASTFVNDTLQATVAAGSGTNFHNGDEIFIFKARSDGLPASGNAAVCSTQCNRYVYTGTSWRASGGSGWDPATHQACLGKSIDNVGVTLRITHHSPTGFLPFINGRLLSETTIMRLEPLEAACTS